MAVSMHNMNRHGGSPLGAGHGGLGGGFAPSPGFPGGPPKIPPVTAPAPAASPGRVPKVPQGSRPFKHPFQGNKTPPWPKHDGPRPRRDMANNQKGKLAEKLWDYWFQTLSETTGPVDGTDGSAIGATIEGYQNLCELPFNACTQGPTGDWQFATGAGSLGPGICAGGQCVNVPLFQTWADVQALATAPRTIVYGEKQSVFTDNPRMVWWRPAGTIAWPKPMIGTIVLPQTQHLPDTLAPPEAAVSEKAYSLSAAATKAAAQVDGRSPPRTPSPGVNRPPEPGDKEEKWYMKGGPLGDAWGMLTEGMDAADCLEKAVRATGARRKKGENGRTGQMRFLYRSMKQGHGDPGVFAACMAMEHAQDKVVGKVNKAASKAAGENPYYRRPVGPGFGGWGQRMR